MPLRPSDLPTFRHVLPATLIAAPTSVEITHTFEVRNTTSKTLVFERIRTSCGCTRSEVGTMALPAGESTDLKVSVNGSGRDGRHTFACFIDVDGYLAPWRFELQCEFAPLARFRQPEVVPDVSGKSAHVTTTLEVNVLAGAGPPVIDHVECPKNWQWNCDIEAAAKHESLGFLCYEIPFSLSFPEQSTAQFVRVVVRSGEQFSRSGLRVSPRSTPGYEVTPSRLLVNTKTSVSRLTLNCRFGDSMVPFFGWNARARRFWG